MPLQLAGLAQGDRAAALWRSKGFVWIWLPWDKTPCSVAKSQKCWLCYLERFWFVSEDKTCLDRAAVIAIRNQGQFACPPAPWRPCPTEGTWLFKMPKVWAKKNNILPNWQSFIGWVLSFVLLVASHSLLRVGADMQGSTRQGGETGSSCTWRWNQNAQAVLVSFGAPYTQTHDRQPQQGRRDSPYTICWSSAIICHRLRSKIAAGMYTRHSKPTPHFPEGSWTLQVCSWTQD